MTELGDLFDVALADRMADEGYVRVQNHPTLPLAIANYTQKAAYDGVWNEVTLQCRGLIYEAVPPWRVVARPFPKFFNHGEPSAPELDPDAEVTVTDKLDGSLGILYPIADGRYAVATRGSFTSEQAIHATDVWNRRYAGTFAPREGLTYLFEIIYPGNRIVCDYGELDDLVLLAALSTDTGRASFRPEWPGLRAAELHYQTLAEALRADHRAGAEGLVVYLHARNERVKIKQDDYVALHRILTGTNARNVWEIAAVHACHKIVRDPKHWGSYLGIGPERAAEILALGDEWLEGVPDEFHGWVRSVTEKARSDAEDAYVAVLEIALEASRIESRRDRYDHVKDSVYAKETMRVAEAQRDVTLNSSSGELAAACEGLLLRCWREATPEPSAPFARDEAIA